MTQMSVEMSDRHFNKIARIVYQVSGISLKDGKEALVRARLMKRVRALRMGSIDAYMKLIESDEGTQELGFMIDVMTTNKTSFFREAEHFNFLRETILPEIKGPKIRFWSAACSSGEEPFTIAIVLRENLADIDSRDCLILATDISNRMLEKAGQAFYSEDALRELPASLIQKYFNKACNGSIRAFQAKENIRSMVRMARLNLMNTWPMKGPFNVIFCRNVMIYFDKPTQQKLINRFWDLLEPGGYLFVGHSEGLSAISHPFHYVRPATYRK
jgi:chemotaxis protein methyltransferase CheR